MPANKTDATYRWARRLIVAVAGVVAGIASVSFGAQEPVVPDPNRDQQNSLETNWGPPAVFGPSNFEKADTPGSPLINAPLTISAPPQSSASSESSPWNETMLESTEVRAGYDGGFVIAAREFTNNETADYPFRLKINGWGQLRHAVFNSQGPNPDLNQFQLARARLVLSGHVFTPDFAYFVQLDGRSNSGDNLRLLDYYLTYDLGHRLWNYRPGEFVLKTGKYKMPFSMARYLSGQELQFADRSVASTYFDVNRSLAWGALGQLNLLPRPLHWEAAVFNGLVTGGAETGSSGDLDNNFAYAGRLMYYPTGEWGAGEQADFEWHCAPATRVGMAVAFSDINRAGSTEFNVVRVVDSGLPLASIIPGAVDQYQVALYAVDASLKYRGLSLTSEYYFRNINGFEGASLPDLFDHGFWLEAGYFVVPDSFQVLARWSRVMGESGTLGVVDESADEVAGGLVWYWRRQHAKLTLDATHLDGAPISSEALDINPGDRGWLVRTQIQFSF